MTFTLCAALATGAAASPDSLGTAAADTSARLQAPAAPSLSAPLPVARSPAALSPAAPSPGALTVTAIRTDGPISLDGVLSEPVWQQGTPVTRFLQSDPYEGAPATERTEVRIAYDEDALYVGARMYDSHPDSIVSRLCRRDVSIQADRFAVFLDPFHDHRSGYYFMVNAAGVQYDGTLFNDSWDDDSWDAVWQAKARRDDQGWTAEMRIPYSQLRFAHANPVVWGIDLRREITRRSERDYLVYPPRNQSGFVSRFPDLVGIDGVAPGGSIEVLPYLTGKAEYLIHDASDPFNDGSRYQPSGGADLRMGVGGNLTLNATANPDFGQVEVDPAVVNLSDVESYFQEKRPFFVENSRIFSFGNEGANDYWGFNWPEPAFFYSRRIGRSPEGSVPDATYSDTPTATQILGAAKLTGKLAPGLNFGTLHAVTAKESAELYGGGSFTSAEIEPLTYYGVVRGQKEFAKSRHGLGLMSSLVARQFDDGRLRDDLSDASVQAGLDGWHFLDRKQIWVVSGWAVSSYVHGTAERITELQRGPQHYLQRPDATSFSVDSSATSLTGYGARLWLNKQSGAVLFNSAVGFMDPKFDVNDLGIQSRADVLNAHVGSGYAWNTPTHWRKYANVIGAVFQSRDFDNDIVAEGVWAKGQIEFPNNYSWNANVSHNPETVNNRRTRGGPLTLNLPSTGAAMYFDTDGKARRFYFLEINTSFSESGSKSYTISPGIEWKPVSSLSLNLAPSFERVFEDAQYVTTQSDPAATATYGYHYAFATLDQKTISAQIRLNWAFTPRLSLQTFLQPLIASGDYYGYKELARPRSYDFTPFAPISSAQGDSIDLDGPGVLEPIRNPDFSLRSLRGNSVLRWEYMPGSTLYLVWTQDRSANSGSGEFDLSGSFDQLVNARANNIFLVKVTYYLNH
jgi:hypothetical protein